MLLKGLVALAALAVVAICGLQAGYLLSTHSGIAQVSASAAPHHNGRVIQVDGGGGM